MSELAIEPVSPAVEPAQQAKHNPIGNIGDGKKYGKQGKVLSDKRASTLEAMRHVYTQGVRNDKTYQHKELRKAMEEDRKQFLAELLRLEKEERQEKRAEKERKEAAKKNTSIGAIGQTPNVVAADETVAELHGLIEKLLGDEDEIAGANAKGQSGKAQTS